MDIVITRIFCFNYFLFLFNIFLNFSLFLGMVVFKIFYCLDCDCLTESGRRLTHKLAIIVVF